MMTFAPRIFATRALDKSKTEPTPAWPLPSQRTKSFSHATRSKAFWIFLTSASLFDDLEIFPREIRLDGDRTHVHERAIHVIHRVHQHGVFVNFLLFDFDKALADGLDVADAGEMLLQRRDEAERRGGLAVVLARGGDENARRGRVHLLAGQFRIRARIKFLIIGGLHADDGGDAENIVRGRATRNVGGGAVQAEQNLAVGIGVADEPDEFAGDVAGIEVGKNQHVRASGDLAVVQFAIGNFRHERGVHLQFAVEVRFQK